jgi:hypothetical protein
MMTINSGVKQYSSRLDFDTPRKHCLREFDAGESDEFIFEIMKVSANDSKLMLRALKQTWQILCAIIARVLSWCSHPAGFTLLSLQVLLLGHIHIAMCPKTADCPWDPSRIGRQSAPAAHTDKSETIAAEHLIRRK